MNNTGQVLRLCMVYVTREIVRETRTPRCATPLLATMLCCGSCWACYTHLAEVAWIKQVHVCTAACFRTRHRVMEFHSRTFASYKSSTFHVQKQPLHVS